MFGARTASSASPEVPSRVRAALGRSSGCRRAGTGRGSRDGVFHFLLPLVSDLGGPPKLRLRRVPAPGDHLEALAAPVKVAGGVQVCVRSCVCLESDELHVVELRRGVRTQRCSPGHSRSWERHEALRGLLAKPAIAAAAAAGPPGPPRGRTLRGPREDSGMPAEMCVSP